MNADATAVRNGEGGLAAVVWVGPFRPREGLAEERGDWCPRDWDWSCSAAQELGSSGHQVGKDGEGCDSPNSQG